MKTILIIEDDPEVRELLRVLLNRKGYAVDVASNGTEGIHAFRTNPTDLIAGLQACLAGILALDDGALKLRDKTYYRALLKRLPRFTYADADGVRVIQPAANWKEPSSRQPAAADWSSSTSVDCPAETTW